jgi:acyl-CoA dehydrogenase
MTGEGNQQVLLADPADTDLLERTFDGLWARHGGPDVPAAARDTWPAALWRGLADAELPWVSVPDAAGGAGGGVTDGAAVWRSIGRTACPLPVAETALAGWLLAAAGIDVPRVPLTVFPDCRDLRLVRSAGRVTLSGHAERVPWAREVDAVVGLVTAPEGLCVVSVPSAALGVSRSANLAGEPRDTVEATGLVLAPDQVAAAPTWLDTDVFRARGALVRAQQMAGAMSAAVARTVAYSGEREQFGRPIGRFQAVAHLIVRAVAETCAARAAADVAAVALESRATAVEVAAAKAMAGEAATAVTAYCHQVHGAIGMTQEYPLHHWTRRLWSWRDEFGTTARWQRTVGEAMLRDGADRLWAMISADPIAVDASGGVR